MINGAYETTTTSGTGTVTLSAVTGRPRFSDCLTGELVPYAIKDGNNWEWGIGTVGSSNTLERTKISATYVAGTYDVTSPAAITLSGSSADVYISPLANVAAAPMPHIRTGGRKAIYSTHMAAYPSTGLAVTADRLYILPFKIEASYQCDGAYIDMDTSGAAATKARLGIYRIGVNGEPTDVICESSDIDTSVAAAILTGSWAETRLAPGWYAVALVCSGTPTVKSYVSAAASTQSPFGIEYGAASMMPVVMLYKTIAGWSSIPASPSSLSVLSAGAAATPAIALKVL